MAAGLEQQPGAELAAARTEDDDPIDLVADPAGRLEDRIQMALAAPGGVVGEQLVGEADARGLRLGYGPGRRTRSTSASSPARAASSRGPRRSSRSASGPPAANPAGGS
jgi:hypothetical protein